MQSIDFTVNKKFSDIEDKKVEAKDALYHYAKLMKNNELGFKIKKWTHFIVCPERLFLIEKKNITNIYFSKTYQRLKIEIKIADI